MSPLNFHLTTILGAIIAAQLSGCGSIGIARISDLKLDRVELAKIARCPVRSCEGMVRVVVSTATDIVEEARHKALNVYPRISFCSDVDVCRLEYLSAVFMPGFRQIQVGGKVDSQRENESDTSSIKIEHDVHLRYFEIFFKSRSTLQRDKREREVFAEYDLTMKPADVFVQIRGGAMWGLAGLISNVVVVPGETLQQLLKAR